MAEKKDIQDALQEKLWAAAEQGDCGAIRRLVMKGVDIEAKDKLGRTAFNIATQYGHSNAAMTILAAKELKYIMALGFEPEEIGKAAKEAGFVDMVDEKKRENKL